jgi:hypothetical protein
MPVSHLAPQGHKNAANQAENALTNAKKSVVRKMEVV